MSVLEHILYSWRGHLHSFGSSGKKCPSTLIWASYQSSLVQYLRGDLQSIYTELAVYGSKNEDATTDNAFSPISEICNGTVSLTILANRNNIHEMKLCQIEIGIYLWPKYQRIDLWWKYSQTICKLYAKIELFAEHCNIYVLSPANFKRSRFYSS